jgi:DNA polymerase III epsilon subunit-like protein
MTIELSKLIGKNVLIYDLETSGLPEKTSKYASGIEQFYDPSDIKKYDNARVVSIAYTYVENFNYNSLLKSKIKTYIRKPHNFIISEESTKIHGITHNEAIINGKKLSNIIADGFHNDLASCDYIVGHNVIFDIYVLLSEFYRLKFNTNYDNLNYHLENKKYLCTGEFGRNICKLPTLSKKYTYKMPKLQELYNNVCKDNNLKFHTAENDVLAVVKILTELVKK